MSIKVMFVLPSTFQSVRCEFLCQPYSKRAETRHTKLHPVGERTRTANRLRSGVSAGTPLHKNSLSVYKVRRALTRILKLGLTNAVSKDVDRDVSPSLVDRVCARVGPRAVGAIRLQTHQLGCQKSAWTLYHWVRAYV